MDGLYLIICWSFMRLEYCRGGIKNSALYARLFLGNILLLNAVSTVCFLFYKKLFIFPKLQIFRHFWMILCCPFNSLVAMSLLRRPASKYSACGNRSICHLSLRPRSANPTSLLSVGVLWQTDV
jgi:hypothetical protein